MKIRAALLLAVLLAAPAAAQVQDHAGDYRLFLQSLTARKAARDCARGIPGYQKEFDAAYGSWTAKNGDRVRRGQAVFRAIQARKDDPNIDREQAQRVQKTINELAQSPPNPTPLELDERGKARCARILTELEAGSKP